jgi:DMSO/TMAO reductase YedYZ molybdopterin-dependent catalytic subunit
MAEDESLFGRLKTKLIDRKQEWAREGRHLTGQLGDRSRDRLPPGQHEVRTWPVLDLGLQPKVMTEAFSLTVDGAVENPLVWNWQDFTAQPQVEAVSDIHCVTAWSRFDNHWQGVTSQHLLEQVRPRPEANHVVLYGHDGYTTNLRLEHFAAADVLLVHSWEGEPLTREHGGPVRLVVPQYYFWKSAKWLKRIEFVAHDKPGYWELRGYHNEGDPWSEQRYG